MRRRPRVRSVLLSILISAAVLLPTATFLVPSLLRWRDRNRVLDDLAAAETDRRERALNALISHAANDEDLLRGAAAQLSRAEPINVVQILNALRLANVAADERVILAATRRAAAMGLEDLRRLFAVYLVAGHGDHPRLVSTLIQRLTESDDAAFTVLVSMLKEAGRWRCPPVPAPAYVRWLVQLTDSHDAASRATAARRGGEANQLADEPGLRHLVERWLEDRDPAVRREGLLAAAELAAVAGSRDELLTLIARSRRDTDVAVARRAWILLDQFDAASEDVLPLDPRPTVSAATLWAAKLPADRIDEALRPLADRDARQRLVGMNAYVSAVRRGELDRGVIVSRVATVAADRGRMPTDQAGRVRLWRMLLALRAIDAHRVDPASRRLFAEFSDPVADDPLHQPLAVVAAHCYPSVALAATVHYADHPVRALAAIEGLRVNERSVRLAADAPPLLRAMAVAVTSTPATENLRPALGSRESTLRDLACTIAARRLEPPELRDLVESLLRDFSDHAKQSGAILAGLSGVHGDLLAGKMRNEDNWAVRQMQRLGMWLQGRPVHDEQGRPLNMPKLAASLLARDDLPRSTILLAMLHMRRAQAAGGSATAGPESSADSRPERNHEDQADPLAILLHPRGTDWIDLHEMLATRRWWHVLQPYLPPEAPPLWLWADKELQDFQIEVLRCWYLVHGRGDAVASRK